MAYCPKCKEYILGVERNLVEIRDVDDEGDISTDIIPRWEYSKFRHECGYVFDVDNKFNGTYITIKGLKEEEDA